MARVVLDNLGKIFPGPRGEAIHAVRNCSLVVEDGEFIVLVGPSGCGKSTTLRMIAGLEDISSGTVSIDDRVVNAIPPKDRDIAMVFQNYALYPHMTVFDNMAFGLKLRKFPKPEILRRVQEAATLLGLSELLDRRPRALSGGQRQRVAVGRAIVRKPSVFLFDEPLSNLDARMRVQTRAELTRLHQRLGSTMIYVTHDQAEAMTMGDRIVVMKDGQIQQIATPTDLYQTPANVFVAGFIGSPPMNLIPGGLVRDDDTLAFQERPAGSGSSRPGFQFRLHPSHAEPLKARADRPIILGLRPEHVTEPSLISGADSRQAIETTVELVEMMGAESFLHLNTGHHSLVARIPAGDRPSINQDFIVAFNTRHARFFDPDTEAVIV